MRNIFTLGAALCALAASAFPVKVVDSQGAALNTFPSEQISAIRMADGGAVFTFTDATEKAYPAGTFGMIYFESSTAVTALEADAPFRIEGFRIVGSGTVRLYDMAGREVRSAEGSVSVLGVIPGIYVVSTDCGTAKLQIR